MSNTVVASDVVLPCPSKVGSGEKGSTQNSGEGTGVAFAESAPLVKVREEFDAAGKMAGESLSSHDGGGQDCVLCMPESIESSDASAAETLSNGQPMTAGVAQGAVPKQGLDGATVEAEISVIASMVDMGIVTPEVAPGETTEQHAAVTAIEQRTSAVSEVQAVQKPVVDTTATFPQNGSTQSVPGSGEYIPGLSNQNTDQAADAEASAGAGTDSVPSGNGMPVAQGNDPTSQFASDSSNVSPETAVGNGANVGLSSEDQVVQFSTETDNNTAAGSGEPDQSVQIAGTAPSTDSESVSEKVQSNLSHEVPTQTADTSTDVTTNSNEGDRPGTADSGTARSKTDDIPVTTESSGTVQAKQSGETESNPGRVQVSGDTQAKAGAPAEDVGSAKDRQVSPVGARAETSPNEPMMESARNEHDTPTSSSSLQVPKSSDSEEPPIGKPLNQEMTSNQVHTVDISMRGEQTASAGSTQSTEGISEISSQVQEVQSAASGRPAEPLLNTSEGQASPFRSSAESVSQQIADSVQYSLGRGEREVVIRLNPPELGSVTVRLETRDDGVTGILEVSKGETRREIEQALPQVVQSLQEAGVQIRRSDLTVADQPQRDFDKGQSQQDGSGQQTSQDRQGPSESWSGPRWTRFGAFQQQGVSTSAGSEATLNDWSRERIDMLA